MGRSVSANHKKREEEYHFHSFIWCTFLWIFPIGLILGIAIFFSPNSRKQKIMAFVFTPLTHL